MKNITGVYFNFLSFLLFLLPVTSLSNIAHFSAEEDTTVFQYETIHLEPIGKTFVVHEFVTEYQNKADMGGNTSVRNVSPDELKWKLQGYFKRNRDLGQLFIPKKDTWVKSIVLRTGPAESAVLYDTPGAKVFMQFFEILGTPVINDNQTPKGTQSTHGFNTNHRTDDFIEGVEYISFPTIYSGVFPEEIPVTKDSEGQPTGDDGKLYYIRWIFEDPVFFEANKRYGFMVGLLEEGLGLGFTLANANRAAMADEPSLDDRHTPYKGGWSFRREGDGTLPPTMIPGDNPPESDSLVQLLKLESLFYPGSQRFGMSPTSDGYPDVDTYRAFEFYIEEEFVALEGLELSHDVLTLEIGQEYTLGVRLIPEDATKNKVNWFSSNASVAEIDSSGTVLAVSEGQAAITVFTENYDFFATCLVTINNSATGVRKKVTGRQPLVLVYPNPVKNGMLNISWGGDAMGEVSVATPEGKVVYLGSYSKSPVKIDFPDLKPGVYVIGVKTDGSHFSSVIVVD